LAPRSRGSLPEAGLVSCGKTVNGTTKIVLVVTVFFVAASLGISLGLADGLAEDGRVDRPWVLQLLGTGWLLATILVVAAMNARRWWPQILLIFCSTIAAVLLSEVVIRLWLPAQYSKARVSNLGVVSRAYHHLQPPNADMFLGVFEGTPVFLQTNADGLRSHHSQQEFSRFTDRIVVLGDSFVFGLGVRQEYTFPEVMESVLRGRLGRQGVAVVGHIADSVQGHGARFVLVVFPRYHHWNPEESPDNWEAELYPIGGPYSFEHFRFFEEVKLEVDYEIVSLLPAFQEPDESSVVFAADPHWNERGHALVAEAMADYLVTNRLLE
jgi:hypothetical protein